MLQRVTGDKNCKWIVVVLRHRWRSASPHTQAGINIGNQNKNDNDDTCPAGDMCHQCLQLPKALLACSRSFSIGRVQDVLFSFSCDRPANSLPAPGFLLSCMLWMGTHADYFLFPHPWNRTQLQYKSSQKGFDSGQTWSIWDERQNESSTADAAQ
jgi:hypothetical protein